MMRSAGPRLRRRGFSFLGPTILQATPPPILHGGKAFEDVSVLDKGAGCHGVLLVQVIPDVYLWGSTPPGAPRRRLRAASGTRRNPGDVAAPRSCAAAALWLPEHSLETLPDAVQRITQR